MRSGIDAVTRDTWARTCLEKRCSWAISCGLGSHAMPRWRFKPTGLSTIASNCCGVSWRLDWMKCVVLRALHRASGLAASSCLSGSAPMTMTSGQGRPAESASERNLSSRCSSFYGLMPNGIQPSPSLTASSNAASLMPPTKSGGTFGRGLNSTS